MINVARKFRIAEARDDVINVISSGHFNFKEFDKSSSMVYSDGKHIINDDNFDYDKSRIMDIVEVSNVEEIAKGEFENYAYTGSDRKFSFWTASADGYYSVGALFTMGHMAPGAILLLKPNPNFPDSDAMFRRPDRRVTSLF